MKILTVNRLIGRVLVTASILLLLVLLDFGVVLGLLGLFFGLKWLRQANYEEHYSTQITNVRKEFL